MPFSFLASTSASASTRIWHTSVWFSRAAMMRAVLLLLSLALTSKPPVLMINFTSSIFPEAAATMSVVVPSIFFAFTSALDPISMRMIFGCPSRVAHTRAWLPSLSCTLTSAAAPIKSCTTFKCPLSAAQRRAVFPFSSRSSTLTLFDARRSRTMSTLPSLAASLSVHSIRAMFFRFSAAARTSAVFPSRSLARTSALASRSNLIFVKEKEEKRKMKEKRKKNRKKGTEKKEMRKKND